MCTECVNSIYAQLSVERSCFSCQTLLRKQDYLKKHLEEDLVQRENKCRSEVLKVFNYKRIDFETQEQYDAYLEKVEDYIFTLSEGTDDEKKAVRHQLQIEYRKN